MGTESKDKLETFAQIIRWFDIMVYDQEKRDVFPGATGYYDSNREKWTPDHNILIHWLCYIVNRQSNVKAIWTRGADAFAGMVERLGTCGAKPQNVIEALAGQEMGPGTTNEDGDPKMLGFACGEDKKVSFTPHYRTDKYLIVRTLYLLKSYNLSLVEFMKTACKKWENRKIHLREDDSNADFAAKLSFAGYLLSYRDPMGKGKSGFVDRLRETSELPKVLDAYDKRLSGFVQGRELQSEFDSWRGRVPKRRPGAMYTKAKRLWCALRDDIRLNGLSGVWGTGFPDEGSLLPYLEITADVWNDRFRKNAVSDWANDLLGSQCDKEHIGAWEIRRLYDMLWEGERFPKQDYFPMQTDIAFDFAPKMCDVSETHPEICRKWCPFGVFEEGDGLCIGGERDADTKKCPLLLYTCGLIRNCKPKSRGCYIRDAKLGKARNVVVCRRGGEFGGR